MRECGRVLAIVAVASLLGGCQSIFGSHAAPAANQALDLQAEIGRYATEQLEGGRRLLDLGQNGLAISAFRKALIGTEQRAAAHNGLAVAYANIGRPDLAERYFRLAMQEAPGDDRYAANLNRLFATVPARTTQESRLATVQAFEAPAVSTDAVSANPASTRLVRTSNYEVRIVAPVAQPRARRSAAASARPVSISVGRRLNAEISISGPAAATGS